MFWSLKKDGSYWTPNSGMAAESSSINSSNSIMPMNIWNRLPVNQPMANCCMSASAGRPHRCGEIWACPRSLPI
ncbi:hypothetical protein ACFSQ7_23450 [Paenibacillus rhizoplanae]